VKNIKPIVAINRIFRITLQLLLFLLLLSSRPLFAQSEISTPLDRITEAWQARQVRPSAALTQINRYLLSDPRYDEARFGQTGDNNASRYDCSATAVFRSVVSARKENSNLDPYGQLWQPWIAEANRIASNGDVRVIGRLGESPIRLLMPHGRLHRKAPSYRTLARALERMLDNRKLRRWYKDLFGSFRLRVWDPTLAWPPPFLAGKGPYISSYFDDHPHFDAGREKRWRAALEEFLEVTGVPTKASEEKLDELKTWTWVISDRVERNLVVWGPMGQSLLFLSPRCFDRAVSGQWGSKADWQQNWVASALHEMLAAFYLNGRRKSFEKDPWMDAVMQGAMQDFLDEPGLFYANGPFYTMAGQVSLGAPPPDNYLRLGTAPLWRFLLEQKGTRLLKKHIRSPGRTLRLLRGELDKNKFGKPMWVAFVAWSLALHGLPEDWHAKTPYWFDPRDMTEPQDLRLKPIDPPKGSIGAAPTPVLPYSFRYVHLPIVASDKIGALKFRWEPQHEGLAGLLFLMKGRHHEQAKFLDVTSIKAGEAHEVLFNSEPPPSEAIFVVINRGPAKLPPESLSIQATVLPRAK